MAQDCVGRPQIPLLYENIRFVSCVGAPGIEEGYQEMFLLEAINVHLFCPSPRSRAFLMMLQMPLFHLSWYRLQNIKVDNGKCLEGTRKVGQWYLGGPKLSQTSYTVCLPESFYLDIELIGN